MEADELRRLAEQDVTGIKSWMAEETERIRQEAGRRTDERRNELEAHLAKHDSIIATEIAGVDVAVSDYRATLDEFFDELRGATNPAEIARRAGSCRRHRTWILSEPSRGRGGRFLLANAAADDAEEPAAERRSRARSGGRGRGRRGGGGGRRGAGRLTGSRRDRPHRGSRNGCRAGRRGSRRAGRRNHRGFGRRRGDRARRGACRGGVGRHTRARRSACCDPSPRGP